MIKKTRLVIVDDHQLIIDGIRALLRDEESIQIVGEASNGKKAIEVIDLLETDVVLLDIDMPLMDGIETSKILHQKYPKLAIIILSMHAEKGLIKNLVEIGVKGYLLKNSSRAEILKALNEVMEGNSYFSPEVTLSLLNKSTENGSRQSEINLTNREEEVLRLIASGFTNKEIGEKLFISHRTVDTHRTNLMKKLDVNNLAGLVSYAIKHGFAG
ncbi:MAG: response regulator transcription factor [Bacteroidetes bacterium]|nr:response regulator transcription factor [Bacteroidota bacterium]